MTLSERGDTLLITSLPLEDMALLALAVPMSGDLSRVLTTLLEGRRVAILPGAFEYKTYRRTAPLGVYQKFVAMERQLRELGVVKAREGEVRP